MHLRQPRFMSSTCGPSTKNKRRIQKFNETRVLDISIGNQIERICFQGDMAYGCFKDSPR